MAAVNGEAVLRVDDLRISFATYAGEVQAVLSEGDDERAKRVLAYERARKNRAGVLRAAEREYSNA